MTRAPKTEKPAAPFSKVLKTLRRQRGLTLREVAKLAGVSTSVASAWEGGNAPADLLAVRRLAQGLGVTTAFLLFGEDDGRPADLMSMFTEGQRLSGLFRLEMVQLLPSGGKKPSDTEDE